MFNPEIMILDPWYLNKLPGIKMPGDPHAFDLMVVAEVTSDTVNTIDDDEVPVEEVFTVTTTLLESRELTENGSADDIIPIDGEMEVTLTQVELQHRVAPTKDTPYDNEPAEQPDENGRVKLADIDDDAFEDIDENEETNFYQAEAKEAFDKAVQHDRRITEKMIQQQLIGKRLKLEFASGVLTTWTLIV